MAYKQFVAESNNAAVILYSVDHEPRARKHLNYGTLACRTYSRHVIELSRSVTERIAPPMY